MYYLLFIVFLFLCCYIAGKNGFIKKAGLPVSLLLTIFIAKVAAGLLTGWMTRNVISDYWGFNADGWAAYQQLTATPVQFFTELFRPDYITWNDLPVNIMIKLVALLDIFTRGNYYINSLFFDLAGLFGSVALYRVFHAIFPQLKWPLIAGCFLLPSLMIFTGTIHKDVLIFCMLGFFCYALYFALHQQFTIKRIMVIIVSLLVMLMLRNYVFIALLPCGIAWIIAQKTTSRPWIVFASVYVAGILLLALLQFFLPAHSPIKAISFRQADFLKLGTARSQVPTDTLYPTLQSLAANSPQAANHVFLRPYLLEFPSITVMYFFAAEILLYLGLFVLMLFFYQSSTNDPFILFSVFFSVSIFMLVGYIVPNMGAITRYRSIFFPWLITPILCHINWQKIKTLLHIKF